MKIHQNIFRIRMSQPVTLGSMVQLDSIRFPLLPPRRVSVHRVRAGKNPLSLIDIEIRHYIAQHLV